MSALAARARYLADQVSTASPAALIVMLYDRLGLDIELAAAAQDDDDRMAAAHALAHGQRVVTELLSSLDRSAWSGADDLAALYRYVLLGLIDARTTPDPQRLRGLGVIVADLRSAWQAASAEVSMSAVPSVAGLAGVG